MKETKFYIIYKFETFIIVFSHWLKMKINVNTFYNKSNGINRGESRYNEGKKKYHVLV